MDKIRIKKKLSQMIIEIVQFSKLNRILWLFIKFSMDALFFLRMEERGHI